MKNEKEKFLKNIKTYALENNIPIIHDETLIFLQDIIKKNNLINILEIGTAIGYSALAMNNDKNNIQTIERDYNKYKIALDFFHEKKFNIEFIWSEALFYQPNKKYDLIFIDAAKVQYQKLFEKYNIFLNKNKFIICDNLNFHNLDINNPKLSRSTKRLIQKMNYFKFFLKNNSFFETTFLNIGDGISISRKKIL
ncbi:O-methyltransferase [Candidatus Phytoplasma sp. AldY-WA1]|jgi:predicted O-methyltransferase YrrM|uniref:O-methyltransferase n=1 Tax=Candidatus Phytoplasma sp. AldY-WA1 TaxID=2852100 RepID=UPI001CE353CF|nr:hypothetical protein [Candidatus Phytoplasma sp. AldY-WA1]